MEYLLAILTGGVAVAVIEGIKEALRWKRERKAKNEDNKKAELDEWQKRMESQSYVQSEALKFILYDRIRFLGQAYIEEGEVDFDDRRILRSMHEVYHGGLGGNGDLDTLMNEVNALKLKRKD